MTALDKYVRLEAVGLWREAPGSSPREVIVSFGNATLVLKDLFERPLGHWALAGVAPVGRDDAGTVYAMTDDGSESLTIRDPEMIAAIAAVALQAGPVQARPATRPRRRRGSALVPLLLLAAVVAAALAAPKLMRADAGMIVPPERAAALGDRMLIALVERHGPLCYTADGQEALAALARRLDPTSPPKLRVLALGVPAAALPGGTILLDRDLPGTASYETVAGWAALALGRDATAGLLTGAGPVSDLRYLVTGDFTDAALARAAAAALEPPSAEELPGAFARLAAVGLDARPFAAAADAAGLPRATARPAPAGAVPVSTAEREALRRVCG